MEEDEAKIPVGPPEKKDVGAVEMTEEVTTVRQTIGTTGVRNEIIEAIESDRQETRGREILSQKGMVDRGSLMTFGALRFQEETFGEFRKGCAFAGSMLGRTISQITLSVLKELCERLSLVELDDERRTQFIRVLASNGISDRPSLLRGGHVTKFNRNQLNFGSFETAKRFYVALLGKPCEGDFTEVHLINIADALEWPDMTLYNQARDDLYDLGVGDLYTLGRLTKKRFIEGPYKYFRGGFELAGKILNRRLESIDRDDIEEVGGRLNYPQYASFTMVKFCRSLFLHRIYDLKTLRGLSHDVFREMEFPGYGRGENEEGSKGVAFLAAVLGLKRPRASQRNLEMLGRRLRLPEDAQGEMPRIVYFDVFNPKNKTFNGRGRSEVADLFFDELISRYNIQEPIKLKRKGGEWLESCRFESLDGEAGMAFGIQVASFLLQRRIDRLEDTLLEELWDKMLELS